MHLEPNPHPLPWLKSPRAEAGSPLWCISHHTLLYCPHPAKLSFLAPDLSLSVTLSHSPIIFLLGAWNNQFAMISMLSSPTALWAPRGQVPGLFWCPRGPLPLLKSFDLDDLSWNSHSVKWTRQMGERDLWRERSQTWTWRGRRPGRRRGRQT